jgi:hypothetical protein
MVKRFLAGVKRNLTPTIALFLYLSKCLMISASYNDAVIILVLGSVYLGKKYLDKMDIKKHNEAIKLDLDKQNQELREELEVVKGALTTIKMEKLAPSKGIPDVKAQANKRIF